MSEEEEKAIEQLREAIKTEKITKLENEIEQHNEKLLAILDTLYSEVCRLEDIEDKKVEVAVAFIEEKRNKYWQDKINNKIKELEEQAEKVKEQYRGTYAYLDEYLNAKSKIQGYKELLEEG